MNRANVVLPICWVRSHWLTPTLPSLEAIETPLLFSGYFGPQLALNNIYHCRSAPPPKPCIGLPIYILMIAPSLSALRARTSSNVAIAAQGAMNTRIANHSGRAGSTRSNYDTAVRQTCTLVLPPPHHAPCTRNNLRKGSRGVPPLYLMKRPLVSVSVPMRR